MSLFAIHNTRWIIDGEPQEPTREDLVIVLDTMRQRLYDEGWDQISLKGLMMKRTDDTFEVFVKMGDYNG